MPPGIIALTAIIVTFLLYARWRKRSPQEPGRERSSSPMEWWLFAGAMGVIAVVEIAFFLDRGEADTLVLAALSVFAGLWGIYKAVTVS